MAKQRSFFQRPGVSSLRQAVDWVAFAGAWAILFNALHPSGIELKVTTVRDQVPARAAEPQAPAARYSGWAAPSREKIAPSSASRASQKDVPTTQAEWEKRFPHLSAIGARNAWGDPNTVFVDARKPEDYAEGHIRGALNFYAEEFDQWAPRVLPDLDVNKTYIIYCNGTTCDLSHHLALKLSEQGFNHVKVFFNGWSQWKKAGYPVTQGGNP